jgi:predicted acetyltransferase
MDIKVIPKEDFDQFCKIEQAAYAGSFKGTKDERDKLDIIFKELTAHGIKAIGAYEGDIMMGCMLYYEFDTNFHQQMIRTAGIGSLAVDLLHKKKRVANALIHYSFDLARENKNELYHLYPFSTEFYRNFGFGYGPPMYTYCIAPKDFIDLGDKSLLSYGSESDYDSIIKLHDDLAKKTHGMSCKSYGDRRKIEKMEVGKLVLAKENDDLIGYMIYTQSGINDNNNQSQKLVVSEMFYKNPMALHAFASFFKSQKDQVDYVQIASHDNHLQQLTRNTCFVPEPKTMDIISLKVADKAMGLMPYALAPQLLLDRLEFPKGYTLNFTITVPRGDHISASIGQGKAVNITIAINEFSSWVTGVISLKYLYEIGQLTTDNSEVLRVIDQWFYMDSPKSFARF